MMPLPPRSQPTTQPMYVNRKHSFTGFVPCTFSTDYLVICGRASARSIDPASAALGRSLDSSTHIIAQILRSHNTSQRLRDEGYFDLRKETFAVLLLLTLLSSRAPIILASVVFRS